MKSKLDRTLLKLPWIKSFLEKTGIRDRREIDQENRVIYVNNIKPDDYYGTEQPLKYANNTIVTSKYTFWNFLPKNLYEQFRRLANFYFLCNIIIMFMTPEPPKNPITSLIPLALVITFTAIKQAYEDILRHREDAQVNRTPVRVLRDGSFKIITRKEILCGDIVEVKANGSFPCDLLLLYTQNDDGTCHITTANLDGETNLKLRTVPDKLPVLKNQNDLIDLRGVIKCDKPNSDLYEFKGKIEINKVEFPLRNQNILLRGATLKISPVIYGCAIYTGKDTKIMLNSKFKANKLSCIERTLNRFMLLFIGLLAIYTIICLIGSLFYSQIYKYHWYLRGREPKYFSNSIAYYLIEILFYISIFSNIIPISMYISIETQRFIGTKFFEWDLNMYDEKTNQPAKANTSDLNEDLGQIEYLFSDKTGTLTENNMIFKQFSLNDIIYESRDNFVYKLGTKEPIRLNTDEIKKFFEILTLCHTVQMDPSAKVKFQASSPDEFSFVVFCEKIGVVFDGDLKDPRLNSNTVRTVNYFGKIAHYELLHTLEFNSDRKRMSVIVKCKQTGHIILLCKGAEDSVFSKCTNGSVDICNNIISKFAQQGWRTLALAYKFLREEEFNQIDSILVDAYNDINNRDEKLKKIFDTVESNLTLVGSTAVEDRLQEDVASTLESLRMAGIKIWVLTGDKKETAINISKSCKHFSSYMEKLVTTDLNTPDEIKSRLKSHYKHYQDRKSFAYIIDGPTLAKVFKFNLENLFRDICMKCDAVLCCRMSPSQKAEQKKPITCAIGDGANDVSMIQEAHVGLGIYGKEGRNAARSSDFAFSKFKHIRRALLIHGYFYYTRLSTLVHYFFYKNVAFVTCQLYYATSSAFSVQSLFHSIYITFYNIFFTSFPIIVFGLFEQRIPIHKLEKNPKYYKSISNNKLLSLVQFVKWNALGLWHSLVAYYFTQLLYGHSNNISLDGQLDGNVEFGSIVFLQVVIIVHVKLLLEWQSMNFFTILSFIASVLGIIMFCLIPNSFIIPFPLTIITEEQSFFWGFYKILSHPSLWLCFLVTTITAIIPDVCIKIIEGLVLDWRAKNGQKFKNKTMKRCMSDVPEHWKDQERKRANLKKKKGFKIYHKNGKISGDDTLNSSQNEINNNNMSVNSSYQTNYYNISFEEEAIRF